MIDQNEKQLTSGNEASQEILDYLACILDIYEEILAGHKGLDDG